MPQDRDFDPSGVTQAVSDTLNVDRVFGEPYEHAGTTVIPVARIVGGTGSGFGSGNRGEGHGADGGRPDAGGQGGGGGYAAQVKPLGVYVVDGEGVHWRPALDLNRVILGGQIVAAVTVTVVGASWVLGRLRRR
jgi:uncharacterized spore protein YtfJ